MHFVTNLGVKGLTLRAQFTNLMLFTDKIILQVSHFPVAGFFVIHVSLGRVSGTARVGRQGQRTGNTTSDGAHSAVTGRRATVGALQCNSVGYTGTDYREVGTLGFALEYEKKQECKD